jgi:putative lipoic acid-binding regulatory protein
MTSLLEFPCQFPIKAMGKAGADFDAHVVEIVRRHVPDLAEGAVRLQPSRNGNYVSVTVTFEASSQQQLDALYRELSGSERTLMVL